MIKKNTLPLSVFIITQDEEERIENAINSVKDFADEIIVVDSGSKDNTVKIAEKLGAKTIYNEWQGFGQQKNFAEKKCRNDWILNIDADEIVSDKLALEIVEIFQSEHVEKYVGFWLKIVEIPHYVKKPLFYGKKKYYLRLYNKNFCSYRKNSIHDSVITSHKNLFKLRSLLFHRSIRSYHHQIEKLNFYSDHQAEDSYEKGKKVSSIKIIFIVFTSFFKQYFLRKYFLYGIEGYIESWMYAFARLSKYAKIKEIYRKK